jgi:DNA-binding XRE family transcriptional regulator
MDELNLRVLSIMDSKQMSKSAFASALEISLPVLTHIATGRNKPGLELIIKIISKFPDINPDWLLLGIGNMQRAKIEMPDFSLELKKLRDLESKMPDFGRNANQIKEYHHLLLKEIMYLNELAPYLNAIQNNSAFIAGELRDAIENIEVKSLI